VCELQIMIVVVVAVSALAFSAPIPRLPCHAGHKCVSPVMGEGDELGGAVSSTFGEIFGSIFKPNAEKQAEIDRAYEAQLEVAAQRKGGDAAKRMAAMEERRAAASAQFKDKFGWQQSKDPLAEFKKRRADGRIKDLSYDDEPKGGIPMPMASFGVGGEFGQGGKYDNGERFDLRLPYADKGWVPDDADEDVPFWENLMSGGKLQAEAQARKEAKEAANAAKAQKKKGPFGLF